MTESVVSYPPRPSSSQLYSKSVPILACFFATFGVADASIGSFDVLVGGFVIAVALFWYLVAFVCIGLAQFVSSRLGKARPKTRIRTFLRRANLFITPLSGIVLCALFVYAMALGSSTPHRQPTGGGGGLFILLLPSIVSCLCAYAFNWVYLSIVEPGERETWFQLRKPGFLEKKP